MPFGCTIDHIWIGFQLRNPQQPVMAGRLILRRDAEPLVIRIEGSHAVDFSLPEIEGATSYPRA